MLSNRRVLGAAIEGTYNAGTAPTKLLRVYNVKPTLLETAKVENPELRMGFANDEVLLSGARVKLEFEMAVATPASVAAPEFGILLRGCGLAETDATTQWEYDPASFDHESVCFHYYHDGDLHKCSGARGTFTLTGKSLEKMVFKFSFTGIYHPVTAGTVSAALAADADPVPMSNGATAFTVGGSATPMHSFEFDLGNKVVYRNLLNSESVSITDRKSTFKMTIDRPNVGVRNWFASALNHQKAAVNLNHLTGGVVLGADVVQFTEPADTENDGYSQLELTGRMLSVAGNGDDDFKLTFKNTVA